MGRGWWYKTLWETAPSMKCHSFRERSNFPRIWFRDLRFRTWGLEIKHMKANNLVWQGCFFFHYYLANWTTDWAQICTGWLFYVYVEIHQVRRLVFDNYQLCPLPSMTRLTEKVGFEVELSTSREFVTPTSHLHSQEVWSRLYVHKSLLAFQYFMGSK